MPIKQLSFFFLIGLMSLLLADPVCAQGIIVKIAGDSITNFNGDGGPASATEFGAPNGITIDRQGNIYIADLVNNRVRIINTENYVYTLAGGFSEGNTGDGGPASNAELYRPSGVCLDTADNLFITDQNNDEIRVVNNNTHIITTVCGSGTGGFGGDGGAATAAVMDRPTTSCIDKAGNIYIADYSNSRIRKVIFATSNIETIAGDSVSGYNGDNIAATAAQLSYPTGICLDTSGNIYISDYGNNRIRKIDAVTSIITTICGTGTPGFSPDGSLAASASISNPNAVFADKRGIVYISDLGNNIVRGIKPDGTIYTVAGSGNWGFSGDGGLAVDAYFKGTTALFVNDSGYLYIADGGNSVIWKVTPPFTKVPDITNSNIIGIFPDPSHGSFEVQVRDWQNTLLRVCNLLGQVVFSTIPKETTTQIDIDNQPPGVYFMTMIQPGGIETKKIIIE